MHSEAELLRIAGRLEARTVDHVVIREPDLAGSATAIGVRPVSDRRQVRRALANLPLFGRDPLANEDEIVRCEACQSPAEHTMRGWICSRTNQNPRTCSSNGRAPLEASAESGGVSVRFPPRPLSLSAPEGPGSHLGANAPGSRPGGSFSEVLPGG